MPPLWRMPLPSGRCLAVRICRAVMSGAGPVPGLEETQYRPAHHQPAEGSRARLIPRPFEPAGHLRMPREAGRDSRQRPADEHDRIEAARAEPIGQKAERRARAAKA